MKINLKEILIKIMHMKIAQLGQWWGTKTPLIPALRRQISELVARSTLSSRPARYTYKNLS